MILYQSGGRVDKYGQRQWTGPEWKTETTRRKRETDARWPIIDDIGGAIDNAWNSAKNYDYASAAGDTYDRVRNTTLGEASEGAANLITAGGYGLAKPYVQQASQMYNRYTNPTAPVNTMQNRGQAVNAAAPTTQYSAFYRDHPSEYAPRTRAEANQYAIDRSLKNYMWAGKQYTP